MHMKLNKESKTILPLFLIIFVMILLSSGVKKGLIGVSAFFCILFGSIREALIVMNPLALINELFF